METKTEFTDEEIRNVLTNLPNDKFESWIKFAFSGQWEGKYSEQVRRVSNGA